MFSVNGPGVGQAEKERSGAVVEALRREQSEVEEQQKEVIRQREAQLEAERQQREALALQLQETKVTDSYSICLLLYMHGFKIHDFTFYKDISAPQTDLLVISCMVERK